MDLKKSFGVDKDAAENGKWFDMEDGGRAKVAKLNSPGYKAEIVRLSKPHLSVLNSSLDTSALLDEITIKAMSRKIWLDWDGITLDGKVVEYSPEKAEELLTIFPDLREVISTFSVERRNFMPEELAEK